MGPRLGRRDLLAAALGGTAGSMFAPFARAAGLGSAPNVIVVLADGAWDTTYCLDPKLGVPTVEGPEVHEDASNPDDREAVETFAGIPVMVNDHKRPSVRRFFREAAADCVVMNGIGMGTIGHDLAKVRLVTAGEPRQDRPDFAVIAGSVHGRGLPLGSIDMSGLSRAGSLAASSGRIGFSNQLQLLVDRTTTLPGANGFESLVPWTAEAADADRVSAVLRARGTRRRAGRDLDPASAARFDAWGEAFDRAERLRHDGVQVLSQLEVGDEPTTARAVGIAVDLLAGGLCHAVFTATPRTWDTHTGSTIQHGSYEDLFAALSLLHTELVDRGMLQSTLVVVLSEFTRTPLYNAEGGKDHWPHGSALLFGGGLAGGRVIGGSTDLLEAQPVDFDSGALDGSGTICSYENFVAGLLELLDVDPQQWLPGVVPFRGAASRMNRAALVVVVAVVTSCGTDDPAGSDTGQDELPCPPDSWVRYDNFAQPLVTTWCLPCHSEAVPEERRQGAQVGMNFDTYDGVAQWSDRMVERLSVRADMPPMAGPTQEERAWFAEWVACGLPEPPTGTLPPLPCAELTWIPGDSGPDLCQRGNAVRGDVVLDTGADASCLCEVEGDLVLAGTGGRVLPDLAAVGGDVRAVGTALDRIELPRLASVGGAVRVTGNAGLTHLLVPSLATVGTDVVLASNALAELDVTGLVSIEGDLRITDDAVLATLDLARVSSVGGTVELSRLGALATIRNPDTLAVIGGDLRVEDDPVLSSPGAFVGLVSVGGSLHVGATDVVSLAGFNALETVGGDVVVSDNPSLVRLVAFPTLVTVGGDVSVQRNAALADIVGLERLTTVGGVLTVSSNAELTAIDALADLVSAGGIALDGLPSLSGLPNLTQLTSLGDLDVVGTGVADLDGLGALGAVDGHVSIESNPALGSVLGLSGLTSIGGPLTIRDNPSLPTSEATSLAAGIAVGGATDISGNGPG